MSRYAFVLLRLPLLTIVLSGLLAVPAVVAQDLPSYAHPDVVSTDETIHGRIASVDGAFRLELNDDRGFVDTIALHQGTIINPTGLTLAPGMSVTIDGYSGGSLFNANEIDTPYSYSGVLPTSVYYGPGYWAPGFGYGYGPSFSIAFILGGGSGHFERCGFYGRPWDGHRYFGGYIGRREYDGSGRFAGGERGSVGASRGFAGGADGPKGHVPGGFRGRSFAGPPAVAARVPVGYSERYPQGGGRLSTAPVQRGFGQRGFGERSINAGGARAVPAANASGILGNGGLAHASLGSHPAGAGQTRASAGHGGGLRR